MDRKKIGLKRFSIFFLINLALALGTLTQLLLDDLLVPDRKLKPFDKNPFHKLQVCYISILLYVFIYPVAVLRYMIFCGLYTQGN